MRNPYRALLNLLPQTPLQVGTVAAIANGVATILLPGGGTTNARGQAEIGTRVFFRDGVIEGPAPSLGFVAIEI